MTCSKVIIVIWFCKRVRKIKQSWVLKIIRNGIILHKRYKNQNWNKEWTQSMKVMNQIL